jgi:steroid delta-isomerase-like uncharacterized protein
MEREELERIDDIGMEAWNNQDIDGFLAQFGDEFVWNDLTVPEPMTTREQARQYMQGWFTAFPDMRATVVNRVVGENAVAAELQFTGTNTGPLRMGGMEIPATGKSVVGRGSYFVKVGEDGKATEFSSHPDAAGMMAQLGLLGEGAPAQGTTG